MNKANGFTILEAVVIIAVLVILGTLGYMTYNSLATKPKVESAINNPSTSPKTVEVKTKADLDNTSKQLDALSVDDTDSVQLDSDAYGF